MGIDLRLEKRYLNENKIHKWVETIRHAVYKGDISSGDLADIIDIANVLIMTDGVNDDKERGD